MPRAVSGRGRAFPTEIQLILRRRVSTTLYEVLAFMPTVPGQSLFNVLDIIAITPESSSRGL
jgi:hypothetical protein